MNIAAANSQPNPLCWQPSCRSIKKRFLFQSRFVCISSPGPKKPSLPTVTECLGSSDLTQPAASCTQAAMASLGALGSLLRGSLQMSQEWMQERFLQAVSCNKQRSQAVSCS
jgi:hypothetical protein